jgi:hypothetical protein
MVVASFVGTTGIIGVITGVTDGVGFTGLPFETVGFTFGGAAVTIGNCARHSPAPPPAVIHSENVVGFFVATGFCVGVAIGSSHLAFNPGFHFPLGQFPHPLTPPHIVQSDPGFNVGTGVTKGVFTVVCVPDAMGDGVGVGSQPYVINHQQIFGSVVGTSDACIGVPFMGTH